MTRIPAWRMLPPAGAPLTAAALFSALSSLATKKSGEKTLRAALAERFGVRHIRFAGTGRTALSIALLALSRSHPDRDEVLVPAYVSFSVPSAVVNAGLKVRLYDVNPADLTPDYPSLRKAVSERALAAIICPQFGLPFDPSPAAALCRDCGAALIDDAAQAMGSTIGGKSAGSFGDAGLFSLSRGKPLTAVDGGILLTGSDALVQDIDAVLAELPATGNDAAKIIKALALLVLRRPEFYRMPASLPWLNIGASIFDPGFQRTPMSRFSLELFAYALTLLDEANASRRRMAEQYDRELTKLSLVRPIAPQPGSVPVYLRFPLMPAPGGEEYLQALMRAKNGLPARKLGISRGFPLPLDAVPPLRPHLAAPGEKFSGARLLAENLVTLPTHDQVRDRDREAIIHFLADPQRSFFTAQGVSPRLQQPETGGMRQ